jgi:hypothetical protein
MFTRAGAQKPSKYVAPSWSWAALNGPVYYESSGWNVPLKSVKYLSYHINTSPDNPYGQVGDGGYIKLQAHVVALKPAKVNDRKNKRGSHLDIMGLTKGRLFFEFEHPKHERKEVWCWFDLAYEKQRPLFGLILHYGSRNKMGMSRHQRQDQEQAKVILRYCEDLYGILVCRIAHAPLGLDSFERVGCFVVPDLDTMNEYEADKIVEDHPVKEIFFF